MKKETYLRKLTETKLTDANTLKEARDAKRVKKQLEKALKDGAVKHIKDTTGEDLKTLYGYYLKFIFDLKPTGSVKVELWDNPSGWGDFGSMMLRDSLQRQYRVKKSDILT